MHMHMLSILKAYAFKPNNRVFFRFRLGVLIRFSKFFHRLLAKFEFLYNANLYIANRVCTVESANKILLLLYDQKSQTKITCVIVSTAGNFN